MKNPSQNELNKLILTDLALTNLDTAKKLLALGADINTRSQNKETPLFLSIRFYNIYPEVEEIIQFFIENGADIDAADSTSATPLFSLMMSSKTMNPIIQLFSAKDANFKKKDKRGYTLLHYVRNAEIAKFLIDKGIDVNAEAAIFSETETPLMTVIGSPSDFIEDKLSVIRILVEHGANVNFKNNCNNTPLHLAVSCPEIANYLLDHGANPNVIDDRGHSPLEKAAQYRYGSDNLDELEKQKQLVFRLLEITEI